MNVLGYGTLALDSKIDDFGDKTIDNFGVDTLRSYFFDDISEALLGGNTDGEVFLMEQGASDEQVIFYSPIADVDQTNPAVVTMAEDIGLVNGDVVTISGMGSGSMTELNDRQFTVVSKSGNDFSLEGEDATGHAAYDSTKDRGTVGVTAGESISFELTSAAWNPWMTEGKRSQFGYIDLFIETHRSTKLEVEFFANNDNSRYSSKTVNMLPNLMEISEVSGVSNANPGQVTSPSHGLSDDDIIYIYGVEGMEAVNGGPYTVTVVDAGNFTIGVDTTNHGVYTGHGVITELPYSSSKVWKRIYAGGTGYQHVMKIKSSGRNRSLKIHAFMPWFRPMGVRPI